MLPGLVAESFLKSYPQKEEVKQDVKSMVARIVNAFRAQISTCSWLTVQDKTAIRRKLDALIVRVAEPDEWVVEPFANQISIDRYLHNMNMIRRYRVEQNTALWHKDIPSAFDRSALAYFSMPLTDVNAYYSPVTNTITVLAGLLQHPFYNIDYNQLSKHAILGTVLGHELSHALDPNGLYWNEDGSLVVPGLLQPSSMEQFYNRTDCIVVDYGDISAECENVNYGNQTIGEDLSDLNGITLSYDAYFKQDDAGKAAGMGDKQHFFMILAQVFCESYDLEHTCEAVASDVHAVPEMRIDRSLRNIQAFQQAFGCHAGQGMYREEEKMCRVF
jgi:predicted metalloendopeptidase